MLRRNSAEQKKVTLDRTVEVRKSLLAVNRASPALMAGLQRDLEVTGPVLTFSVAISHEGSARPVEVLQALAGPEAADAASFVRVSLSAHGPGEAGRRSPGPRRRCAPERRVTAPKDPVPAATAVS